MNASIQIARKALEKGKKQGQKDSIDAAVYVMALCLLDSGLCENTTKKLVKKAFRLFDSMGDGRVSLLEVRQTLKEEYNFEINFI